MTLKMKKIIFIFLISHVLSVYYIKQKQGSVIVTTEEGIVYLDADNFDKNDKIHIQFNAYESHVDEEIHYEFSDNIPNDYFQPSISKQPDKSWSKKDEDDYSKTYFTVYDIKKNIFAKYLIIKYTGYYNYDESYGYLKIENTENTFINRFNFGTIIMIILFSLAFLIPIIYTFYIEIKKRIKKCLTKTKNNNIKSNSLVQKVDIYHEPNNNKNDDTHDDSNDINAQQQTNLYEPPFVDNVDRINDS